ncbi:hypothetical protein J2S10_002275 [Neobacillus ginsengisoli]|uniref:Uncharacterized protein n=1 Tax=Neobacillus ginsengisoli TaxID=904295 RepID=A0ABT9XU84_9BACI|nr:hypothetical protein [Neobacillus ginsengisoli]
MRTRKQDVRLLYLFYNIKFIGQGKNVRMIKNWTIIKRLLILVPTPLD